MLGRFLEISLHTPDVLASLDFYQRLGFETVATNEVWPHPYAVVSDGRLFLGLHQSPIQSPTLTFVLPELSQHLARLRQLDIVTDREHLRSDAFNELSFHDPHGQPVRLLEARSFSPPDIAPTFTSGCGYFVEYGLPVKDFDAASWWEALDFINMGEATQPFTRLSLTSQLLNIGLYRSRALRYPMLTFEDPDMRERLSHLKERGFELSDEMPDSLDEHRNAVLIAPEGTRLLLMQMGED